MAEKKLDRPDADYAYVRNDIVDLLQAARLASARSINAVMAAYWEIGRRIVFRAPAISIGESDAKHRQTADRLRSGHLVLQNVPMFLQ